MLIQRSLYVALFAIPALACVAEPAEPAELTPEPETQFRSATWDEFPIVMHGITVNQLSNYTITIDGDPKDLNEIIDVAAYFSVFRPCEDGLTPDLDSFNYSTATAYIDAANTDYDGFHCAMDEAAPAWRSAGRALVLGAGGAATAVAHAVAAQGGVELTLLNRTLAKAEALAGRVARHCGSPGT